MTSGARDRRESQGPFPELRGREHPWLPTEIEHGPFERRRAGDRRAAAAAGRSVDEIERAARQRRHHWGRRKSDVLTTDARKTLTGRSRLLVRRFRQPLIGLTLAGLAAPLLYAGLPLAEEGEAEDETDREARPSGERDLDDEVGDYWAESAEALVRDRTIEGAAVRYGISRDMAEQIYDAATRYDIEPDMAYGLVFVESTFRERAVSHVGARGLAQVMPRTAQWLDPTVTVRDLYDPEVNLDLGFKYLRQLIDKYDGDAFKALTAYNRGPGTVDRILRRGGNIDNGYAGKVLAG